MSRKSRARQLRQRIVGAGALLLVAMLALALVPAGGLAQADDPVSRAEPLALEEKQVQVVESYLDPGRGDFYHLQGLELGDALYVSVERTSGNLDPMVALSDEYHAAGLLSEAFWGQVDLVVEQGADPLEALPKIYGSLFVAWDDDSGPGYGAAMVYEVAAEGDFQLLVTSSPASSEATADTFGGYRMLIGVNEPEVLTGSAEPAGDVIAIHDRDSSQIGETVQVIEGELTEEQNTVTLPLAELSAGDELNVYADSPDGSLRPVLVLEDFGGKPLASSNLGGKSETALLSYRVGETAESFQLSVRGFSESSDFGYGKYRLVLTVNAPEEAVAGAMSRGLPVVKQAIEVGLGVVLQQITDVNQVAENFGAVVELTMEWQDPLLAFSPDSCNCTYEVFTGDSFSKRLDEAQIDWPQFTLFNQQGNRWVQNRNVVTVPDGGARYSERFTTDFQAPDFNFRKFPFDTQTLYIRVHSLYPEDFFVYTAPEELSGIGDQLGEEEWQVIEAATEITEEDGKSRYALRFVVRRYLQFYIFRIFVPILLIIIVSWFIFFLKDYGKRVDVAGANLLVFVAFNFTVSGELPRLGYLTFMDAILIGVFVISAFVVVFNVYLKRLELAGKHEQAARIDHFSLWLYPLTYATGAAVAILLFLVD